MALLVYINSKLCDLTPKGIIALSFSTNKIGDAINPSGIFSNQFKLPKTQNNIDIFEVAHSLNSDTDFPYKKLPCRIILNGRELISDGFAIIEQSQEFYEIACYGGNLDFFEKIKDKKLSDLDFTQYDIFWSRISVSGSRVKNSGSIFPIIDWNSDGGYMDNVNAKVDIRTLFPAMFQHTIVSEIFKVPDFNKSGAILNDSRYLSEIIPCVDYKWNSTFNNDLSVIFGFSGSGINHVGQGKVAALLPIQISGDGSFSNAVSPTGTYFNFPSGKYRVRIKFNYSTLVLAPTNKFVIGTSGVNFSFPIILYEANLSFTDQGAGLFTGSFNLDTILEFKENTQIHFGIYVSAANEQDNYNLTITQTYDGNNNTQLGEINAHDIPKTAPNQPFPISINLPDMTHVDFLKFIAQKYGIIFQTNSFTKTVEFRQFKEIYDNIPKAVDWTKKRVDKNPAIKYHANSFAQKNFFKWDNDTGNGVPENLGRGEINIADASLSNEKTMFALPFSATDMVKRFNGKDVPIIRMREQGAVKKSIKPRCLILRKQNFSLQYYSNAADGTTFTDNIPMCYFQLDSETFNLGFDNSLLADNYNEFNFFLAKYKEVEQEYLLDANDIYELDFFIPVYDDFFKHYFFISKINNFVAGKPTKVTLIRL